VVLETILEQMGPFNETPDGTPLPMKLEARQGGRWFGLTTPRIVSRTVRRSPREVRLGKVTASNMRTSRGGRATSIRTERSTRLVMQVFRPAAKVVPRKLRVDRYAAADP
jgi:hypothetical protein